MMDRTAPLARWVLVLLALYAVAGFAAWPESVGRHLGLVLRGVVAVMDAAP